MPPVFAHGRLRLYLLKLLAEAPRHGYEVIRLLEERFQGLYAPSAGTVYPRLAKLEAEGLVWHTTEGGRKVYSITAAGRAELAGRGAELADLELEIGESVSELAAEIRDDVRGAAGRLRGEVRAAAHGARHSPPGGGDEADAWRTAREELRRAEREWKEQARRARDESRRAREDADAARLEMQRFAQQVRDRVTRGEGLHDLVGHLGGLLGGTAANRAAGAGPGPAAPGPAPGRARATGSSGDPARDLDRLLDRFRDDIRDAARDHGVTEPQLDEARRHLSTAAARIAALLRAPGV
ncbi:PadR family transcriptional regulator [Streptomyces sp. HMX112]|uniref:PadR family transcriptional regulator n=1 Tax=Streptomyces sp. HMX112 TaxID=3390850 RepID=UPI003A801B3B